jgi:hypothetical protein
MVVSRLLRVHPALLALSFGMRDLPFGYVVGVAVCYRDSFGALVGTVARCCRLRMLLDGTNDNAELVHLLCVLIMKLEVVQEVQTGRGAGMVVQVSAEERSSRRKFDQERSCVTAS